MDVTLDSNRHSVERLRSLLPILRCPESHGALTFSETGGLKAENGRPWDVIRGVPNFLGAEPLVYPDEHFSNDIAPEARHLLETCRGLGLNVSAGGTFEPPSHVVEVEYGIFRNTDLAADVHSLPFQDEVFSVIACMNAFEHYHSPEAAARELYRTLRRGGIIIVHTAFLQPVHEAPNHFFGCTEYGLRRWFEDFEEIEVRVTPNFNPLYALSWFASELEQGLRTVMPALADQIGGTTLEDLAKYWRERDNVALTAAFAALPDHLQRRLAAGFQYVGRKRL